MGAIQQLLIGLLLMAVSGLAFVAYRHPEIYEEVLFNKLIGTVLAIYLATSIWSVSNSVTFIALAPFIAEGKIDAAKKVAEEASIPFGYAMLTFFGIYVYLFLLSWLARQFLKAHNKKEKP